MAFLLTDTKNGGKCWWNLIAELPLLDSDYIASVCIYIYSQGDHLNYACLITDITVTVGIEECDISFLATNQLSCRPPDTQPRVEDSGYGPGNSPRVTVYVGSLSYVIGYLRYTNRTERAVSPLSEAILGAIVAVAVGVPVIITVIVVYLLRRRREAWEKRNRLNTGSSAQSNDYYEIQRMAARNSEYQIPIDFPPGKEWATPSCH